MRDIRDLGLKDSRQKLYSLSEDIDVDTINLIGAVINIQHKEIIEEYNIPLYKFIEE